MTRKMAGFIMALGAFAMAAVTGSAWSQETLKVAIPQRGAWDAGVAELGQRGASSRSTGSISRSCMFKPARNRSKR